MKNESLTGEPSDNNIDVTTLSQGAILVWERGINVAAETMEQTAHLMSKRLSQPSPEFMMLSVIAQQLQLQSMMNLAALKQMHDQQQMAAAHQAMEKKEDNLDPEILSNVASGFRNAGHEYARKKAEKSAIEYPEPGTAIGYGNGGPIRATGFTGGDG